MFCKDQQLIFFFFFFFFGGGGGGPQWKAMNNRLRKSANVPQTKTLLSSIFVSSAKNRHYEKTLKSSGKCFIYGKLLRHTNKVSLRFLLRDTLHEAFVTWYQKGNFVDNHSQFLRDPK